MTKKAIITGITGQDGAYLTAYLLELGYNVVGTYRRTSTVDFWRLRYLGVRDHDRLSLVEYDLTDPSSSIRLIKDHQPDELYNLAAQSFVGVSFEQPITTSEITGLSVTHLLEAIRIIKPDVKFYQASTSEMFGKVRQVPQSEQTPFYPRSPYGVAKLYAHWMTVNYRESYDIFASSGILFNHESPLRGREFVTRKITHGVSEIVKGKRKILRLGNLDAERDWGYAREFVVGMHAMLQTPKSDTYVLATGRTESVRYFSELAFKVADIEITWSGEGENEVGRDALTGERRVEIDPALTRPAEVDLLIGDSSKAKSELDWKAETDLEELCKIMVEADLTKP